MMENLQSARASENGNKIIFVLERHVEIFKISDISILSK